MERRCEHCEWAYVGQPRAWVRGETCAFHSEVDEGLGDLALWLGGQEREILRVTIMIPTHLIAPPLPRRVSSLVWLTDDDHEVIAGTTKQVWLLQGPMVYRLAHKLYWVDPAPETTSVAMQFQSSGGSAERRLRILHHPDRWALSVQ